jgi:hypothetical protein
VLATIEMDRLGLSARRMMLLTNRDTPDVVEPSNCNDVTSGSGSVMQRATNNTRGSAPRPLPLSNDDQTTAADGAEPQALLALVTAKLAVVEEEQHAALRPECCSRPSRLRTREFICSSPF